jgi:hypothetical protein
MRAERILSVRRHLKHMQIVIEGLQKYGMCPAIEHELKVLSFVNKKILARTAAKRKAGNRHDIYVGVDKDAADTRAKL